MRKPKHYFQRTFRQDIFFFIGWKKKAFEEYCKKHMGFDPELGDCYGVCMTMYAEGREPFMLVWVYDKKRTDIIAHECTHAANSILQSIGNKPSHSNDEVLAYLIQELYNAAIHQQPYRA